MQEYCRGPILKLYTPLHNIFDGNVMNSRHPAANSRRLHLQVDTDCSCEKGEQRITIVIGPIQKRESRHIHVSLLKKYIVLAMLNGWTCTPVAISRWSCIHVRSYILIQVCIQPTSTEIKLRLQPRSPSSPIFTTIS